MDKPGPDVLIEAALDADPVQVPDLDVSGDWEDFERTAAWVIDRLRDPFPSLHERLTWIWHDHFPVSWDKIDNPAFLVANQRVLRRHALGNFRDLVNAILKDPAMLVYLDGVASTAEEPNKNLARELMELFTLGRGHYSATDVRQAALALTGWDYDYESDEVVFDEELAYVGSTTILGTTGRHDSDDVADIVCAHPACAPLR
ncbi:MAG: hypothetical protein ACI8Y4_002907 [Candidatus Poriferisodalaceae bacterium]